MISLELRDQINQVISKTTSIEDFEEWLVPRLPELITPPNSIDSDVVAAIELGFAEMAAHIRTEEEFIEYLHDILNEQSTTVVSYSTTSSNTNIVSGSSNQTIEPTLIFPTPVLAL